MKILFYFGHPAQYLFLRETIKRLISNGYQIKILIKTKDVLESLVQAEGFEYENILAEGRKDSKTGILIGLIKRLFRINKIVRKFNPDILLGTDASIAQLAWLYRKTGVITLEDDAEVIPQLAKLAYPFAKHIITPVPCSVGKWFEKKIGYAGYMKLGYLHPNIFSLENTIIEKYQFPKNYVIIRLAKLTAHHDFGIKGISNIFLDKLISGFENKSFLVFVSSEDTINDKYKKYLLRINPSDMHHVLAGSSFLICDSQSMAMEAAMLGIPSIRFSSFVGKISVLEELEHKYRLTFGVNPNNPEKLFSKLDELLSIQNLKEDFQLRRKKMLADKIDVTVFLVWFIENYPESVKIMKENPDYQYRFK